MESCALTPDLVSLVAREFGDVINTVAIGYIGAGVVLGLVLGWVLLMLIGAFQQYRATGSVDAESF